MNRKHIGVLFGGILLLAVAMGISRFAFTPILPFMRQDEGLSFEDGGLLASSNYVGYFVGALWAGFIFRNKKNVLLLNVMLNVSSIILMGIIENFNIWIILRFIAGVTSGFIFVLTSSIIMDYLASYYQSRWAGFLFSGIGSGIAISGLCVPFFESAFKWEGAWIGLGILSICFFMITAFLWKTVTIHDSEKVPKTHDTKIFRGFMPWLVLAYGLEGLGYIITGTFLVDIIYNIESLRSFAGFSWVITGLAAIPAAPFWTKFLSKYSAVRVLSIAYILQIIGIVLPVFFQTAWSVLLSAALFGITFVGIVALSTGYARELYPKQSGSVVSILTTAYALGQIIGPIVASKLEAIYESFKAPLSLAGIVVTVALATLIAGRLLNKENKVKASEEAPAISIVESPEN